jgi:flavin reductase (DIM6/NTAB) family NADH-FMN oxidoreductase RutF
MTVTADQFRELLASLPAGVTVVTAALGSDLHGATCSAVCSVSAEPPQLLVCLSHASRTGAAVRSSGRFAVNILRDGGESLAARFASPTADRFGGLDLRWHEGAPVLPESALVAWATCEVVQVVPAGTHDVVVGSVVGGQALPEPPLLYFQRAYRALRQPAVL